LVSVIQEGHVHAFWRKPVESHSDSLGVALTTETLAVVRIDRPPGQPYRLLACEVRSLPTPEVAVTTLHALVRELAATGLRCCFALAPDAASLQLVAAPPVREEEIEDAARWLVRDLVDFPLDDAAIGVGAVPHVAGAPRGHRILVAAARGSLVREVEASARTAGLRLISVIAHETALLAASRSDADSERNVALLEIGAKSSLLCVGRGERLCMVRRLPATGPELDAALHEPGGSDAGGAAENAPEELLLHIQRSLDYHESDFGLGPVTDLLVAPSDWEVGDLIPHLAGALAPSVRIVDIGPLQDGTTIPHRVQTLALPALGAALVAAGAAAPSLWRPARVEQTRGPTGAQGMRALAAASILVASVYGFDRVRVARAEHEAARLEAAAAAADAELDALRRRVSALAPDPALAERLDTIASERDRSLRRLELLSSTSDSARRAFPVVLNALAQQVVPGVWLREIRLSDSGRHLDLVGSADAPERVPRFVEKLAQHPGLAGFEFHGLQVTRDEDLAARVDFELRGGPARVDQP
jgi:MSHA biogenesis protein MshI